MITCPGASFASRVGASLLSAANLPELALTSLQEYRDTAIRLANNRNELQRYKKFLKENRSRLSLFDTRGFTQDLECAFQKIYENALAGLRPQSIRVSEIQSSSTGSRHVW
jgi:protein O-GlcNAc transferase